MRTLAASVSYEETIRKSRFLVNASPVDSEAATLDFFTRVAEPKASVSMMTVNPVVRPANRSSAPSRVAILKV
jgi:putative IMPACT (imprinted ancient) family translation regulator